MKKDLDIPVAVKLALLRTSTRALTDCEVDYADRGEDAKWPPHADEYRRMKKGD